MPLNLDAVGTISDAVERVWTATDALTYAVAVGAGADPLLELNFTTENSAGVRQMALPTMGVILGAGNAGAMSTIGSFDRTMLVHAEQGIEVHRTLETEGRLRATSELVGIEDKGSGALVTVETRAVDATTDERLFTTRSSVFLRGEGGFAPTKTKPKSSGPHHDVSAPSRPADHVLTYSTLPQQALLYRLCGDRNPLHSDPTFAARAGFDRPILHGLCTYGFTGRALLHALCASDPARFLSMHARFSHPVVPGQDLTISIWNDGAGVATFRTTTGDGTIVIDRGRCTFE